MVVVNPGAPVSGLHTEQEVSMKTKAIALAASVAALSFAAVPIAQAASSSTHRAHIESRIDRSRDVSGKKHVEPTRDRTPDLSRDLHDR